MRVDASDQADEEFVRGFTTRRGAPVAFGDDRAASADREITDVDERGAERASFAHRPLLARHGLYGTAKP
ncbi:MAG: hypothetical protein H0X39_17385 [Actinobacteria bacterium]|nr:hypothetical protein [Actinomycetota bacterium]